MDISAWLRELGLERYEQAFRENEIDAEILPKLTADDLKDIGVTIVGHRRKLLEAIAALAEPVSVASRTEHPGRAPPAARPPEAERRQLTVLFCDLVGSTELSAQLDPEDMGHVIRAYHRACAEVVERWDGHVAKYMGDGVLAYFGWPRAHEDDAERAVRAGLDLVAAVAGLTTPDDASPSPPGSASPPAGGGRRPDRRRHRSGRGGGRGDAEPGGAAAGARRAGQRGYQPAYPAAHRWAVRAGRSRPAARSKASPSRLAAFRVVGEGRAEGRFEALHGEHLTPLVGREHELGILLERWAWAKDGDGQVVLLAGEPGIGKSRIVQALRAQLAVEVYTPLSLFCSPYHTNSALHPVIEQLKRAAGFEPRRFAAGQVRQAGEAAVAGHRRPGRGGAAGRRSPRTSPAATTRRPSWRRSARPAHPRGAGRAGWRGWRRGSRCSRSTRTCTGSTPPRWRPSAC